MEKDIYIVVHGEVQSLKMDPILSQNGIMNLEAMPKTLLPEVPSNVISGIGTRYGETAELLDLDITAYNPLCGTIFYLESISPDSIYSLEYEGKKLMVPRTEAFLQSLPNETVLIADKIFLLGILEIKPENIKDGNVFKITLSSLSSALFGVENTQYDISNVELIFSPITTTAPW
ncbi:hypothetical protein GW920_00900 [Candidatus Falkowbacteria bacterium]|uniref:Uncharacterized protein n=1 Tax=Candidatus Falkowbacteria bacterium CG10_big_fil_rev_8_21_14_0_10_37_18 TaxID=1974562 RepID=A0A2H0VBH7_9BACT|nr:hypothetical protein [Candidatus Falkowbacteria bacterium]NCQ12660.1 hypothetical protein [Candidatus Falkowbacteria bacterium]OIO06224.1 MAG: hypothetical protein AUJ26_01205 [Candidatus Falkowbacteria bacterium CG1_02_37_21]PIR95650.1 MAG: hypothetical protein COT93_01305 [Candidatus Falkowbacteria bacterium CG10_big_fil_rev_8_21_14_0_10_37_18]